MKKRGFILTLLTLFIFSLVACNNQATKDEPVNDESVENDANKDEKRLDYEVREVNFYRNNTSIDRKINLRFYYNRPNIPYVGVSEFFKEFYNTKVTLFKNEEVYTFKKRTGYIKIDHKNDILTVFDIADLGSHPDFKDSNSIIYLSPFGANTTTPMPKVIDLHDYYMDTYGEEKEVYLPLQLISNIVTSCELFQIVYNEEALFEFDYGGQLSNNVSRMEEYYGELYKAPYKSQTERKQDVINFSYNLICLMIDHFRGYTTQMEFVDNNIVSLGLNGTLERKYSRIKELLLSKDRKEYIAGVTALFLGLADGGHTGLLSSLSDEIYSSGSYVFDYFTDEATTNLLANSVLHQVRKKYDKSNLVNQKTSVFGFTNEELKQYYYFDSEKKLAYLGFDSFDVNYDAWDEYYEAIYSGKTGTIPSEGDTYAFIRGKLYQALDDGVENLVVDLTTNGGGDSSALLGLVGLFNGGNATLSFNDTVNHFRSDNICKVDINLDGKYNNLDKIEAEKFKAMNIVILTSNYAFSCGNLLPSLLKEYGYKTIGEKTGGGSCAIMLGAMGDGLVYVRSSFKYLANDLGQNIDSGVDVDFNMLGEPIVVEGNTFANYSKFYDLDYVNGVLIDLFKDE